MKQMKKSNVLLAMLLAVSVLFGTVLSANAASAEVMIEIEATDMNASVNVPILLPVIFEADGGVILPTDWEIDNTSMITGIRLVEITVDGTETGWEVLGESVDVKKLTADSKAVRFKINDRLVAPESGSRSSKGKVNLRSRDFVIHSMESRVLLFDMERGAFTEDAMTNNMFTMELRFEFI